MKRRWSEADKEFFRRRASKRSARKSRQGESDWAARREWEALQEREENR